MNAGQPVDISLEPRRLDDLARSFSQLGRPPEGPPSDVDLLELLRSLARAHSGEGIRVEVEHLGGATTIQGHLRPLEGVFRNLLTNALEAMEGAGMAGEIHLPLHEQSEERSVVVTIDDQGPGLPEELRQDLRCAVEVFRTHGIRFSGYRYPYLRRDAERVDLLGKSGFEWDSSEVVSWHGLEAGRFDKREWDAYERILATYEAADADAVRVLPRMSGGLVEVPVSVPDDDILVERLRLDDDGTMVKVWAGMVRRVRERRELLVLQVHPERFEWYRRALESTLRLAREGKDVWAASLGEIARWWREREDFGFEIEKISDGRYRVVARCTDRATILLKKGLTRGSGSGLWGSAVTVDARTFEVESPVKPVIGVDPETPTAVVRFLKEEGFAHTVAEKEGNCSFFLRHRGFFGENEKRRILESVEEIRFPLVRFWRWPEGARYSLAVTGDIDGVDLLDFWGRFYG